MKPQTIAEEAGVSANAPAACQLQPMQMQRRVPEQTDCWAVTAANFERPGQLLPLKIIYNHGKIAVTINNTNCAIVYNHTLQSHNILSLKPSCSSPLISCSAILNLNALPLPSFIGQLSPTDKDPLLLLFKTALVAEILLRERICTT